MTEENLEKLHQKELVDLAYGSCVSEPFARHHTAEPITSEHSEKLIKEEFHDPNWDESKLSVIPASIDPTLKAETSSKCDWLVKQETPANQFINIPEHVENEAPDTFMECDISKHVKNETSNNIMEYEISDNLETPDSHDSVVKCEVLEDDVKKEPLDPIQESDFEKNTALSLPDGLCIIETNKDHSSEGSRGVWTTEFMPKGTQFGPYPDDSDKDRKSVVPLPHRWTCSIRRSEPYNIESIRIGGQICYRTTSDIQPGTDLVIKQKPNSAVNRRYQCMDCGKSFTWFCHFQRHKLIHSGEKPHECSVCGKCFALPANLKTHSSIHSQSEEKLHQCLDCGKSYAKLRLLQRHKVIHTGLKPHNCVDCDKSFTSKDILRRHRLIHTGVKPNECSVCKKSFIHVGQLQAHSLTHTGEKPHQCLDCGKKFTLAGHLHRHKLTHSGERPHECTICGKCFGQAANLRSHKLIHTGEKPHTCLDCGKAFVQARNLLRHRKRVHMKDKS